MSAQPRFAGRDPADVAAEAVYAAMTTLPAYAEIALECERLTSSTSRAAVLASVDDETRAQAVAFMQEPHATRERDRRLSWARSDSAQRFPALLTYYAKHIPQFVDDWALTFDPRLRDAKLIPFKLYPRQHALAQELLDSHTCGESLTVVKARDSGASWLAMCLAVGLAIFEPGFTCLIGSQLEVKIDQSGTNANTLFGKARMFLEYLPEEFRGGWSPKNGNLYMRLWWPNGSVLFGQAGEAIGRGERASVAVLDEYAHLLHPDKTDEALMATTQVKWYISSVNGTSNPFARRAMDGKNRVFRYTWRDDPKKTQEWADKMIATDGQRKFDREYGCDFLAGNADQMIKQAWLDAATDAHVKLGIVPTGRRYGGLDIGAGGDDANAFAVVHGGMLVEHVEIWPSSVDQFREVEKAMRLAESHGVFHFAGDAVGVGAGIEGSVRQINERRKAAADAAKDSNSAAEYWSKAVHIGMDSFKSSESPVFPLRKYRPTSKDLVEDILPNRKSQGYDDLARRLEVTFNAVTVPGYKYDRRDIVSFASSNPSHNQLMQELAQITSEWRGQKLYVDKYGDGASPNAADAVMMALAPTGKSHIQWGAVLESIERAGRNPNV
jgi:phage terminase large subunit